MIKKVKLNLPIHQGLNFINDLLAVYFNMHDYCDLFNK